MSESQTNQPEPAAVSGQEIPDWVNDTPRGSEYYLLMQAHDGDWQQDVELDRDEFEALKQYLATMRNIPAEAVTA
jgi:hypothetical protein